MCGTAGLAPIEGDIDPANDCVNNDGSVVASATTADLQLVKTASPAGPTALAPGDTRITYSLTVTNAGPDDATSVTLTDPLPMYSAAFNGRPATSVGATVAGGTGGTCTVGATVTCNLGTVLVGTPKVVTVTVNRPMRDGAWRNTADVYSSAIGDSNRANNTSFADVVVQPLTDIELTSKTVTPTTVKSGVEATYVITLRNNGPSSADNVTVTDTFAAMGANGTYTFISATASDGGSCPTAPASGISAAFPVVCNFGTVPATGVRSMSVVIRPDYMVAPPAPRTIQNTASVTTTTQESNAANNARSATLTIDTDLIDVLIEETDLADPVGYSPATPNTNVIVYKVDITNRGPSLATGVQFTDTTTPPAGKSLTFICDRTSAPPLPHNVTTACAAPATCTGTNPVTCAIGQMAASSSTTRYLVYRVNDAPASSGDTYNKTATVSANENETLMGNNSDPEQTTIRMLADMQLVSKTPSLSPVNLNQPFVWTIVGRNNGPGSSTNSRLTDTLPSGMELTGTPTYTLSTAATGNCTGVAGGNSVTCVFGDLAINDTATVTVPVRLTAYPSGGTSTNTARVFTDSIDPTPGNDSRDGVVNASKSSIACTVFADVNDDGVKQPAEVGIGGVTVRLTGTDLYANAVSLTTTTNGSGACLFDNLPPSDATGYTLTETHPAGYLDGQDNKAGAVVAASKGTDLISAIVLNTNQALTGYTFGELQTASIAGRVWHDVSDNAVIEGGETVRIAGVTVTLTGTDDQGAPVNAAQVTNGSGAYAFTNLRPGTYTLTQTQPAGWLEGRAAIGSGVSGIAGTPDTTLSSPTYGNVIANIGLQSGNAATEYNFGELQPASVAGLVWYDADNSGTQNGTEPVLPGVTVTLTGTDYRGVAIAPRVLVTGPAGTYSFTNLKPGSYVVTETQPADYADGQLQLGTVNATPSGIAGVNVFNGIVLPSAGAGINYNFGERGRAIAGTVYADDNDDGIKQPAEPGIPGVQVTLNGCAINRTVATDAFGNYNFTGLPDCPGGYIVAEAQPAGFSDGKDTVGTAGGVVTNDNMSGIVLGATTFASGYNFGEHGIVATDISCVSPVPAPAKNVREPFNWIFTVNHVSGGAAPNTRLSNTLPAGMQLTGAPTLSNGGTCTGIAGQTSYVCTVGFLAPTQVVTVTAPVRVMSFPAGGTLTNTSTVATDGNDLVNTANNTCQSAVNIQQATIAGTVYEDPNNDGIKQPAENGISNVSIRLTGTDLYNNPVDTTLQTIANGTYAFTGLAPSNLAGYTLTETQPGSHADGRDTAGSKGGTVTNDNIAAIPLLAAENATDYNFGEIGQGLAGSVYVDSNDNGIRDPGERGIPNVAIRVTGTSSANAPVDVTMTTDVDGNYLFGGLPASNPTGYTVVETQPAAWADGKDKVGTIGGTLANDRLTRVVLPAGRIATGYDFGERGARLCGYVYSDRNDNAFKDTTEVGIPAATITLTGTDMDGNAVTRTTLTTDLTVAAGDLGRYCITDLPLPNGAGYTLTETQPIDTTDGRDTVGTLGGAAGNDVITGIRFTTPGITGENYNFGERITNAAALSGFVWFDANHDRVRDLTGRGGWTVELVRGTVGGATTTIATTQTAPDGSYRFDGLPPGGGYSVVFRNPQGNYIYGYINNVTLTASTELTEQNQPIDPSGVVYDVLTRQAVSGAVVRIDGPVGFDPALHLVGGPANVAQTTDATGEYKFLLLPGSPTGTYRLSTTVPSGYIQRVSTALPACTATLQVGGVPNPALVQRTDTAPATSVTQHNPATCPSTSAAIASNNNTTQYYLAFVLGAGSANVINNHIPVERNPTSDTLIVTKTTPKAEVSRGELVPYTITVRNTLDLRQTDIAIQDQIPPGFQYRVGSAMIEGQRREPTAVGRQLTWGPLIIERNQVLTVKLLLVVGTGVGTGEFVNQAWASSAVTNAVISNVAKATVRVVPDATFDCSEVIGKVFDDKNRNGVQDDGEAGIANARVATVRGQLVTTDQYGRFHIACADIPDEDRGSNYVLKLDERTLPTGYRLTTENPGLVRLTRGKMSKINFGASTKRVVRVDLKNLAFMPNTTTLQPQWSASLDQLLPLLQQEQSVLRLAYGRTAQEDPKLAQSRMQDVVKIIRSNWRQFGGNYPLSIETEVYQSGGGAK
jgi:uncharacterized repeat protein (TIGR01451 family)